MIDRRLPGLDALRGLAAVSIMLAHIMLVNKPPTTPILNSIAGYLTLAVPLFFCTQRIFSRLWLSRSPVYP